MRACGLLLDLVHRVVDGGGDQVLEHFAIFGGDLRLDLHALHFVFAAHRHLDHAAAGFTGDFHVGDLVLGLLHVGLQRHRLLHHVSTTTHRLSPPSIPLAAPIRDAAWRRNALSFRAPWDLLRARAAPRRAPRPNGARRVCAGVSTGARAVDELELHVAAEILRQRLREPLDLRRRARDLRDRRASLQRIAAMLDERAIGRELARRAADVQIADDARPLHRIDGPCGGRPHDRRGRRRRQAQLARRAVRAPLAGSGTRRRAARAGETPACAPASSRSRCADPARSGRSRRPRIAVW